MREFHRQAIAKKEPCDILVVAHGHILRCLGARWVQRELNVNPQLILDAGGVGTLSYEHHNIDEPSIFYQGHSPYRLPNNVLIFRCFNDYLK